MSLPEQGPWRDLIPLFLFFPRRAPHATYPCPFNWPCHLPIPFLSDWAGPLKGPVPCVCLFAWAGLMMRLNPSLISLDKTNGMWPYSSLSKKGPWYDLLILPDMAPVTDSLREEGPWYDLLYAPASLPMKGPGHDLPEQLCRAGLTPLFACLDLNQGQWSGSSRQSACPGLLCIMVCGTRRPRFWTKINQYWLVMVIWGLLFACGWVLVRYLGIGFRNCITVDCDELFFTQAKFFSPKFANFWRNFVRFRNFSFFCYFRQIIPIRL